MPRGPRQGRRWLDARRRVFAASDVCWICGDAVDMHLPYRDPDSGRVNPRSKSVDHRVPLNRGGPLLDPANLALAHLGCNSGRQDNPPTRPTTNSREW